MASARISSDLRALPVEGLPVAQMVIGQPAEEAAALLPRLFNLCRVAQGIAARAAFGVAQEDGWQDALRLEILKEHVFKLCLRWPGQVSALPVTLPRDWSAGGPNLREALFGSQGEMPVSFEAFSAFLRSDSGIAPVLRAISQSFGPSEAVRPALPLVTAQTMFDAGPQENSVAARHAQHPVMVGIEEVWGRGPLWSAVGLACDVDACLDHRLPAPDFSAGRAVVPAARGFYGVKAQVENGVVTAFDRITPTDHLLMPNGVLDHALASLPEAHSDTHASVLLSILDPCFPVTLASLGREEAAHA